MICVGKGGKKMRQQLSELLQKNLKRWEGAGEVVGDKAKKAF